MNFISVVRGIIQLLIKIKRDLKTVKKGVVQKKFFSHKVLLNIFKT